MGGGENAGATTAWSQTPCAGRVCASRVSVGAVDAGTPIMRELVQRRRNSLIMRPEKYHTEDLISLLRQRKIATMGELKQALGTAADATVFRKLAELDYRTSYSHRGRFYTLEEIARFDAVGLWSFRSVWFSRFGTLVATVEALVAAA